MTLTLTLTLACIITIALLGSLNKTSQRPLSNIIDDSKKFFHPVISILTTYKIMEFKKKKKGPCSNIQLFLKASN